MNKQQICFLKELSYIQEYCVNVALINEKKFLNTEELLENVTGDVIYRVMELIDGYACELPKFSLVNTITGEVLNERIELHDKCVEYLNK